MLMHPLFKALATQPEVLAEHAGAYLQLAGAEATELAQRWRLRLALQLASALLALLGLGLAAAALMLLAALPLQTMPAPWALALLPALPLGLALAGWLVQRRVPQPPPFALLRQQWQLDRSLLQQVGHG